MSRPRPGRTRLASVWSLSGVVCALLLALSAPALAKDCKKGKKPCGNKCISAKKVCKEEGAAAAPAAPAAKKCKKGKKPCGDACIPIKKACQEEGGAAAAPSNPEPRMNSASTAAVAEALEGQAGRAMLELAKVLTKSKDLDVTDDQRKVFRQGLRGVKPPLSICAISHVQLVRDCDNILKGTVTLPCYLAVDEVATVCEALGQKMPQVK